MWSSLLRSTFANLNRLDREWASKRRCRAWVRNAAENWFYLGDDDDDDDDDDGESEKQRRDGSQANEVRWKKEKEKSERIEELGSPRKKKKKNQISAVQVGERLGGCIILYARSTRKTRSPSSSGVTLISTISYNLRMIKNNIVERTRAASTTRETKLWPPDL